MKVAVFAALVLFVSIQARATELDGREQLAGILSHAYENNPTLRAARAELRAIQELAPQALSGWKPTVEAKGNITSVETDGSNFGGQGTTSKEMELGFSQPLYRGGRTVAATDEAHSLIKAQRAMVEYVEQDIALQVVTAFMDVVRDRALVELSKNNRSFLSKELEATKDRFEVGELTRTDISQAEARFSAAESDVISTSGDLKSSVARYEEVVGLRPGNLIDPVVSFDFPENLEDAITYALKNNPSLIASEYIHRSAESDVDELFGGLLPELGLFGSWNRQLDPQPGLINESTTKTIGISATIPLYQAGRTRSQVRQAKHTANQRYLEILETRRSIRQQVITNWESFEAAKAEIESRKAQVNATRLAKEGVSAENELGARSVLDLLDAEQEHLDARTALVTAKRNKVVAEFALAHSMGILTPQSFGRDDFQDEFEAHLETIKWKILGMDVDIDKGAP